MPRRLPLLVLLAALSALVASLALSGGGSSAAGETPSGADHPADRAAAKTQSVYVRPVTTEGEPVAGWQVKRLRGSVDCDGTSPSAVNPGIAGCYPTAYALRACFKSAHHTVLCVRDARTHTLIRVRYQGSFPSRVAAPRTPAPMDLALVGGRDCLIRDGGAWSSPESHPNWVGFYSCTRHGSVYGPGRSHDGINRSEKLWSVHLQRGQQDRLVRRDVRRVWYVGFAPASR